MLIGARFTGLQEIKKAVFERVKTSNLHTFIELGLVMRPILITPDAKDAEDKLNQP
jgi:hypothetical protein